MVALFIDTYGGDELTEYIQFICREFLRWNMINVNVISYREGTNVVQAHTFYPYDGDNCASDVRALSLIEECAYSDDTPDDPVLVDVNRLRRKIPNDLHNCELRMAASVFEPYVFYDEQATDFPTGTEVIMARTIARALKMRPVFKRINETRENRLISNETGIYSLLLNRYDTGWVLLSPSTLICSVLGKPTFSSVAWIWRFAHAKCSG